MISVKAEGFNKFGWEKAIHYQDCMDMGWEQVHNLHDYNNQNFNSLMHCEHDLEIPILTFWHQNVLNCCKNTAD